MSYSPDLSIYTAMELKGTIIRDLNQTFMGAMPPPRATKSSGNPVYFRRYSTSNHPYFKQRYMILCFGIRVSTYTTTSGFLSRDYLFAEGDDPAISTPGTRLARGQNVMLRRPLKVKGCDYFFPVGYKCVISATESTAAPKVTGLTEREQERALRRPIKMAFSNELIYKVILEVQDPDQKTVWYETKVEVEPAIEETATGAP